MYASLVQFCAVSVVLCCTSIAAQSTQVVPNGVGAIPVLSATPLPWDQKSKPTRVQYIYDTSHFSSLGLTAPILITRLRWRAMDSSTKTWTGGTYQNVEIELSSSPFDHSAASATFAKNHGNDRAMVFDGAVKVTPGTGAGGVGTSPFFVDVTLSQPFLYDPAAQQDLCVDLRLDGTWSGNGGNETELIAAQTGPASTPQALASQVFNQQDWQAVTGSVMHDIAAVLEISYTQVTSLYAEFSGTPRQGAAPLAVQFADRSFTPALGGILFWSWDFDGDGIADSVLQNPTSTFGAGVHTVSLTVADQFGVQSRTASRYVEVDALKCRFSTSRHAGGGPLSVAFTDLSTRTPTAWAWDFDSDGTIDSTKQNPTHVFQPGLYTVTLTASNAINADSEVKRDHILVVASTNNELSADTLSYQFNEIRGRSVANTASASIAPPFGSVNSPDWRADAGRSSHGANEAGFGCLGNTFGSSNWSLVSTAWPMRVRGDMTIMWWHRNNGTGAKGYHVFGGSGGQVSAYNSAAKLTYSGAFAGITEISTNGPLATARGVWEHMALVIDDQNGVGTWYRNGKLDATTSFQPGEHNAQNSEFRIGWHDHPTFSFVRAYDMDDFRLYQRALTSAEVVVAMAAEDPTTSQFGDACPGPGGAPEIGASGLAPVAGNQTFTVTLANAERGRPAALVVGFKSHAGGTLPIDLSPFLGAGCSLQVTIVASALMGTVNGAASLTLPIPLNISGHVYGQCVVAGSAGAVTPVLDISIH